MKLTRGYQKRQLRKLTESLGCYTCLVLLLNFKVALIVFDLGTFTIIIILLMLITYYFPGISCANASR